MKRITALILAIVLLGAAIIPASAAVVEPVKPYFTYIHSTSATFLIDESSGIASCFARCTASSSVTVRIVGALQQYKNGSWTPVTSWITNGSTLVMLDKQRAVYSGYHYRFIARFYIYDSNGNILESDSITRTYNYGAT